MKPGEWKRACISHGKEQGRHYPGVNNPFLYGTSTNNCEENNYEAGLKTNDLKFMSVDLTKLWDSQTQKH